MPSPHPKQVHETNLPFEHSRDMATDLPVNVDREIIVNEIYEETLKRKRTGMEWFFHFVRNILCFAVLTYIGFFEPWSAMLFAKLLSLGAPAWATDYIGVPIVMMLRAVIVVEAWGYVLHRFIQHLGWMTRRALAVRFAQRYHWIHHMIYYPIGKDFIKDDDYQDSTPGINWSWVAPFILAFGLMFALKGVSIATGAFIVGGIAYGKVVQNVHERFHMTHHSYVDKPYFKWLEDIHILHHWDQGHNYGMVNPIMDILFGTFMDPKKHPQKIAEAFKDYDLTASDIINWRYLLTQATPAEYAAFICAARKFPRSLRKVDKLLHLLRTRMQKHDGDLAAPDLYNKALDCLKEINTDVSLGIMKEFPRHALPDQNPNA